LHRFSANGFQMLDRYRRDCTGSSEGNQIARDFRGNNRSGGKTSFLGDGFADQADILGEVPVHLTLHQIAVAGRTRRVDAFGEKIAAFGFDRLMAQARAVKGVGFDGQIPSFAGVQFGRQDVQRIGERLNFPVVEMAIQINTVILQQIRLIADGNEQQAVVADWIAGGDGLHVGPLGLVGAVGGHQVFPGCSLGDRKIGIGRLCGRRLRRGGGRINASQRQACYRDDCYDNADSPQ